MERRKHPRIRILVDLEMAIGQHAVTRGVANDLSREGVSLLVEDTGTLPAVGDSVILSFKIWTGRERLTRAVDAHVVRAGEGEVGLRFNDNDPVAAAAIQDLLFYLQFDQRHAISAA